MAPRPLVNTVIRTEFGDVLDSPELLAREGGRDLTYVPGFSDMRLAYDLELADVASGRKAKHEAKFTPLPVNVRWTRATTPRGAPDGMKQIATANLGYRTATKDDIGQPWLTALPPGATLEADGTIRKGDCLLTVADGKTAARNAARKQVATSRLTDDVAAAKGGILDIARSRKGTDAFVKKEA